MQLEEVITGMTMIERAKKIKDYCKSHTHSCKPCIFYCGVCSLGSFHPCDWDFKDLSYDKIMQGVSNEEN